MSLEIIVESLGIIIFSLSVESKANISCDDVWVAGAIDFANLRYKKAITNWSSDGRSISSQILLSIARLWGLGETRESKRAMTELRANTNSDLNKILDVLEHCSHERNSDELLVIYGLIILALDEENSGAKVVTKLALVQHIETPMYAIVFAAAMQRLGQEDIADEILVELLKRGRLSQYEGANLYMNGTILKRRMNFSRRWMERAAKSGHVDAQGILGYMYTEGIGGEVNLEKAKFWFERQRENPDFQPGDAERFIEKVLPGSKSVR